MPRKLTKSLSGLAAAVLALSPVPGSAAPGSARLTVGQSRIVVVPAPSRTLVVASGNLLTRSIASALPGDRFDFDPARALWVPKTDGHLPAALVESLLSVWEAPSRDLAPEEMNAASEKEFEAAILFARGKARTPGKPVPPPPSPYSDQEIADMAKRLAQQYKGSPWSYTEYNSVLYPTLDHLRQQGVPERQIALFKKTCDDYPGRPFNPWSGD